MIKNGKPELSLTPPGIKAVNSIPINAAAPAAPHIFEAVTG
jgi:hypothetical protein